nr:ABC transporter substrate-binding protein [Candidatus Njordarchaeum guaymaensis]
MPMSTGTKRILAVVVVAVIAVGVVGVYLVITPSGPQYQTPGMPAGVASNRIIKIGILDPMTEIQGDSCWKGAYMAVREINTAGGILINGTDHYYLGLIAEDTYEADPSLDITKGVAAATKILTVDGAQFIIGGFRTESLKAYIETVMDKKTIFLGTGAATDYFSQCVFGPNWASYNRYKYFFRIMPINSTSLGKETITELAVLRSVINASALVRTKPVKYWAILRENLDWT